MSKHPDFSEPVISSSNFVLDKHGNITPILANVIAMLRTAPEWHGVLAYDEFTIRTTTKFPAPWHQKIGSTWTDYDDSKTCEWMQQRGLNVKTNLVAEAVQVVAKENAFHPVREYLTSIKWDGEPRIDRWLIECLGCDDTPWARAIGPRWLISAVARIMKPGCKVDHTLLLEGPQGIRKSTSLRTLAGDQWFSDHIEELGSKDSRADLQGKWILEMSELDRIRGKRLETVKSWLVNPIDIFRPSYGRRSEAFPRQCVFAGTVNDQTPLTDETGNRRFWPVRCGAIDLDALSADRDLIWAEAYDRYKAGSVWWLETDELNTLAIGEQNQRYSNGPWDDIIMEWAEDPKQRYSRDGASGELLPIEPFDSIAGQVTVTDVLLHAIGKPLHQIAQNDQNQVARCLIHEGWIRRRIGTRKHRQWFYVTPEEAL